MAGHLSEKMSDMDFRAMVAILERHRRLEEEMHSTRLRLAGEVGFDVRHPSEVKVGDRVRPSLYGGWYTVTATERKHGDFDGPHWVLDFDPGESTPWVILEDLNDPVPPTVVVAVPEPEDVF